MGLATPADGSSTDAKLQETLFNWWGWSLSAPRPGKTMDKNGDPAYTQSQPTGQFDLTVDFDAKPGSLPKLRYGTAYRLRARAVDLAGNRTPREAVTRIRERERRGHVRPLRPGRVARGRPRQAARRGRRARPHRHPKQLRHAPPTTRTGTSRRRRPRRHWPRRSATSTAANGGLDADAYKLLQQKDGGSWTDIGKPDPNNPGVYLRTESRARTLPYLPDLLSRGVALRELPGSAGPVKVPFYDKKAWPDAAAVRPRAQRGQRRAAVQGRAARS